MKKKPLVSIIISAYNHEKYIDDCILSIFNQTYSNIEVILFDDCSTDQTYRLAKMWEEKLRSKYSNVVISRNKNNLGLPKTLNQMLKISQGEYIKPMASDDFFFDQAIESMVAFLENNREYGLLFGNGVWGDSNTHYPINNNYDTIYSSKPHWTENLFEELYKNDFISVPTVMIRSEVYSEVGGYDENLYFEDWDLFLRIAQKYRICFLNRILVMYRRVSNSMSNSSCLKNRMEMRRSELEIVTKYKSSVSNKVSKKKIYDLFNNTMREAFCMRSKEYISFAVFYAKKHQIRMSFFNLVRRYILYPIFENIIFFD